MQTIDQFFIILFALMSLSLLVVFSPVIQNKNDSVMSKWWSLSLGLYAGALLTFALIPWFHPAMQTPANIGIMGSLIFCALLFRSWRQPIANVLLTAVCIALAMLGIVYEALRQNADLSQRIVFVTIVLGLSLLWQIYELVRLIYAGGSRILKFILFLVVLSFVLTLTRTFITLNTDLTHALNIFGEELSSRLLRWTGQATVLLTFFGIGAFYLQRQSSERNQMIDALVSKENTLISQAEEKSQIQRLLDERNELISSLIQAKKSAETGALSVALAHELNQPLSAIQLNAECLQMELTSVVTNPLINRELIERILSDNKRAAEIIVALKQIFSNSALVLQRVDLVEVISSLEKVFLPLAKQENIAINRKYPSSGGCHVEINTQEFQHVVLNLLNNANDALSETKLQERHIEISISKNNNYAYLSVSDSGKGIDPSMQTTIFNLLSSTKFAGTGLGLWLSQHIIERHKGRLYLDPQPGWSTTFVIELPLND
jgi:signal transduction histidine kinase